MIFVGDNLSLENRENPQIDSHCGANAKRDPLPTNQTLRRRV
jgi:hypothetical protein